jgi:hypothetical protein
VATGLRPRPISATYRFPRVLSRAAPALEVITEVRKWQAKGIGTYKDLADILTGEFKTPRGKDQWEATQVKRILSESTGEGRTPRLLLWGVAGLDTPSLGPSRSSAHIRLPCSSGCVFSVVAPVGVGGLSAGRRVSPPAIWSYDPPVCRRSGRPSAPRAPLSRLTTRRGTRAAGSTR